MYENSTSFLMTCLALLYTAGLKELQKFSNHKKAKRLAYLLYSVVVAASAVVVHKIQCDYFSLAMM